MFKQFLIFLTCQLLTIVAYNQTIVSETEAVALAIKNSANISAAGLSVLQQKQLLKSSFNLPNPEVFIESPTGNFYTASITQSIEFPTVYTRQRQLQKQRVVLTEKEKQVAENEVKLQVRQLYISAQYATAFQQQLQAQDTLYERISIAAARQFDAGQIDYLQKIYAENQYGEIHNQYVQARLIVNNLKSQLQYLTGLATPFLVAPFNTSPPINFTVLNDSIRFVVNPSVEILRQEVLIAGKNIELQKAKALPGLAIGYFNQGEKSTPFANRFRAGITLPIWFGQYKSNIAAAKTAREIKIQKTTGLQQQLALRLMQAQNDLAVYAQSMNYYQTTGIKRATEMINTARRFFESGEYDYINYLRNINEAYSIQLKHLEAIKNYSQAVLSIKYLTGTL